jgi:hypothetical protein
VEIVYGAGDFGRQGFAPRRHVLREVGPGTDVGSNDSFGEALTTGDFNCDGYPDLAIGHPRESSPGISSHGAVTIVFGGRFGAAGGVRDYWPATRAGLPGKAENGDRFGSSLAAADFNRDACDDLAIGIPGEDQERFLTDRLDVGHVTVLYGGRTAMAAGPRSEWHQDKPGVESSRGDSNFFGWALSVGDFDRDDFADLVVGVPGETVSIRRSPPDFRQFSGMVHVFYGTFQGLSTDPALGREPFFESPSAGKASLLEANDGFGSALP